MATRVARTPAVLSAAVEPRSELTPAAQQILSTASRLFVARGIRAVGVDTIAAESGVTKMTLYKHFGSKDELVAAHLRAQDQQWRARWRAAVAGRRDPVARLLAVFDAYEDSLVEGDYRGCAFLNAAGELPDLDHPARAVVTAHKAGLRKELAALAARAGVDAPRELADELMLLLEGGYVTAAIRHGTGPLRQARKLARRLVDDRMRGTG